ncbi:MAG: hypothetical protein JWQ16_3298 [Novosphingobium sp.]|jgi:hypothetical protein|nr:hypothetical protein [Novosphingobium sp.]
MNLNYLLSEQQIALIKMTDSHDPDVRDWAGTCADYYAGRITVLRERMEIPVRTFDFRNLAI